MGNRFSSLINKIVFHPPYADEDWKGELTKKTPQVIQTLHQTPEGFYYVRCEPVYRTLRFDPLKTVVFCHGNGADILQMAPWFRDLCNACCVNVVGVEYRGYGAPPTSSHFSSMSPISSLCSSSETPSEQECINALQSVMQALMASGLSYDNVYLVGHSLGTGVVSHYASLMPPSKNPLVLISPYKSISRVAYDSFLGSVVGIEMFPTYKHLTNVHGPVKIFHGDADLLIGPHHAIDLHKNLNDASLPITWLPGANHNGTLSDISFSDWHAVLT